MLPDPNAAPVVVKVGGSLLDMPDLGQRLTQWLDQRATNFPLLIPGGGPTTDVVRQLDRVHTLGEERSHWLALRALTFNAHFLAALVPGVAVARQREECPDLWQRGVVPVLDAYTFLRADEGQPGCLAPCWEAASDAVAARVAHVVEARRLVLLKSVSLPSGMNWAEASRHGLVDTRFADVIGDGFNVEMVNFRQWRPV